MKKRLFSLALALAICLGLSVPASAVVSGVQNLSDSYEVFYQNVPGDWSMAAMIPRNYGLKDKAGNVVIPAKYTEMSLFKNLIFVGLGNNTGMTGPTNVKWGVINIAQTVILPLEYEKIRPMGRGVTYDYNTHVYDSDGFIGYYEIQKNGLVGVASENFSVIVKPSYRYIQYEEPGYFKFSNTDKPYDDNLTALYDTTGRQILPMEYQAIKCLEDDLFAVKKNDLWGVVNNQNQVIVPLIYQDVVARYESAFIVTDYREQYKNVSHENEPKSWDVGEHWQHDGIVGVGGEVLVDFEDYEHIKVDSAGRFTCSKWTGEYEVGFYMDDVPQYTNKYTYEYLDYKDLDITTNPSDVTIPIAPIIPSVPTFSDVPSSAYFAAPVSWAVSRSITNGTSSTAFSPDQTCTQAQILTFLYRAVRNGGTAAASDMDEAVSWAREKGMIDGGFNGGKPCTRASAVEFIWQAMGSPLPSTQSSFEDVSSTASYASAVSWAVDVGVTNGTSSTTFSPNDTCTRGQIVTFLHRAMG